MSLDHHQISTEHPVLHVLVDNNQPFFLLTLEPMGSFGLFDQVGNFVRGFSGIHSPITSFSVIYTPTLSPTILTAHINGDIHYWNHDESHPLSMKKRIHGIACSLTALSNAGFSRMLVGLANGSVTTLNYIGEKFQRQRITEEPILYYGANYQSATGQPYRIVMQQGVQTMLGFYRMNGRELEPSTKPSILAGEYFNFVSVYWQGQEHLICINQNDSSICCIKVEADVAAKEIEPEVIVRSKNNIVSCTAFATVEDKLVIIFLDSLGGVYHVRFIEQSWTGRFYQINKLNGSKEGMYRWFPKGVPEI